MLEFLVGIAAVGAALLAICGIGYYLLALLGARSFARERRCTPAHGFTPPVSILKPLRGTDPDMYAALRSHCVQDYPAYELVFSVAEADDPAVALVQRLRQEFPQRDIQLVICPGARGANMKVSNLVQALPFAHYDHLVINDSDIRVPPGYLRRVLAPLSDPQVGMVTSLYRGIAAPTLGSRLESVGISTDFCAGVLAARKIEGIRFALGSTLAFPRTILAAIGGFEAVADYLADDFELGARVAALGYRVVMADVVVDCHLPEYAFTEYWNHQLRWARSTRYSRKWGHLGEVLTFGLPWAMLAVVLARGASWAWALLALTLLTRLAMALGVGKLILKDPQLPANLVLLPFRDILASLIWMGSYTGRIVSWRGDRFVLENGKLKPSSEPWRPRFSGSIATPGPKEAELLFRGHAPEPGPEQY